MDRSAIESYYSSLAVIKSMLKINLIVIEEYKKSEDLIAKRHCIKDDSIYRTNYLINPGFRAINVTNHKEVKNNGNEDNENKHVTTIR